MRLILLLAGGASAQGLDVNAATLPELEALAVVGPAKARALDVWRRQHGPCTSLDDLRAVPGYGLATVRALEGLVHCGSGPIPNRSRNDAVAAIALAPAMEPRGIDPNRASVDELQELPGIDAELAAAIVTERIARGPFADCSELQRVRGIGPATAANVRTRCQIKQD